MDMIARGRLAPGGRLNEVALANELGISRGPLREAIQRLVGHGVVTVVTNRGAFVRKFTRPEVDELYELRIALESHIARLVVMRADEAGISRLRADVDRAAAIMADDKDAAYPPDHHFHSLMIELSGNAELGRAAVEVQQKIVLARRTSAQVPSRAREALYEHTAMVDAIADRDPDAAAALMRRHLHHARRGAINALGIDKNPAGIQERIETE